LCLPPQQPEDLIVDATVALLREHGLMDAKELVRNDASVLMAAAEKALAIREAEAAERAAAAAVPDSLAGVADALKRSPLMLEVGGDHPGLEAIAELVRGWWLCSAHCICGGLPTVHSSIQA
jgi:hypothetical protein